MGFLENRDLSNVPTITEFYKGKTILITGGSGFMGQVLIEKLLYSCSELNQIILLMRHKKAASLDKRLADLYSSSVFERLKREKPGLYKSKLIAVTGDVAETNLGLFKADQDYIKENVNIIFHSAASVRFNDDLPTATNTNIRSARELTSLAKEVKNLLAYVHVSTCYSNTNHGKLIEEKLYPPHADWRDTIEICDNIDKDVINFFTNKYIGKLPNTYVFTKQLAEHLVSELRGQLPVIIIRPSVVISSAEEPMAGWANSFNGPAGLCIGYAKGLVRDVLICKNSHVDYVPVDYCIRHFLAAAWIRGTKPLQPTDQVEIYNCSAKDQLVFSAQEIIDVGGKHLLENPPNSCIWPPNVATTNSSTMHYLKFIVYQLLPAILIDTFLWVIGQKTIVVKIQRKLRQIDIALGYYLTNSWQFDNKNFLSLGQRLKEQDREHFDYNMKKVDKFVYLKNVVIGGKKYLLHEDLADIPKARVRLFWMKVMAYAVKTIILLFIAWKLFSSINVQNYLQSLFFN